MNKHVRIMFLSILVLVMALCFVGCDKEEAKELTAQEAYTQSLAKTNALASFTSKSTTKYTFNYPGQKIEEVISMVYDEEGRGTDDVKIKMVRTVNDEYSYTMYYTNGYSYRDLNGVKTKSPMEYIEFAAFSGLANDFPPFMDLEVTTLEKDGEGWKLFFTVDNDSDSFKAVSDGLVANLSIPAVISSITYEFTISKDLYITTVIGSMEFATTDPETFTSLTAELEMTYIIPETVVTVTLPSDLDSYTETTE